MSAQRHQNRVGQHFQEQGGGDASLLDRCCQVTEDSVRENPMVATVAAFGVGITLGAVLGGLLAEPAGLSHRRTAETVGRRMLDTLAEAMPPSVRHHIHT